MRNVLLPCALLFSACSYQPSKQASVPDMPLPVSMQSDHTLSLDTQWWTVFASDELNQLMQSLDNENLTLQEAQLRVVRAKQLYSQSVSQDWPQVTARLSGREGQSLDTGMSSSSSSGDISIGYELDIWGQRSATQLSRQLAAQSAEFSQRSTALQVQSLLASTVINQLSLQQRLAFAQQNVEASEQLLTLINARYQAGAISGVEVNQQRNTLITAQADVMRLTNALTLNQRAIAVLLGDSTMQNRPYKGTLFSFSVPDVMAYFPASILRQRPDVMVAGNALKQADITVYQASLAGLPGLGLSADISVNDLTDLASGWTIGAVISSAATLFDGGNNAAAEAIAKTDLSLALNQYRAVVLDATAELLNSVDTFAYQNQAYALTEQSLENNDKLYRLAQIRYKSGETDFLTLLNAQRSWFAAQQAQVSGYQSMLDAAITVYRAAGGRPTADGI